MTASAVSPSRAASSASSSGWLAPSRKLKLVWQCSSAYGTASRLPQQRRAPGRAAACGSRPASPRRRRPPRAGRRRADAVPSFGRRPSARSACALQLATTASADCESSTAPPPRSVIDGLDGPVAGGEREQQRPAVREHDLEPGPAPRLAGRPPAFVDRPGPGPAGDLDGGGLARPAARPGRPVSSRRALTPTGRPSASSTTAGSGWGSTRAGAGLGSRPGQGGSAALLHRPSSHPAPPPAHAVPCRSSTTARFPAPAAPSLALRRTPATPLPRPSPRPPPLAAPAAATSIAARPRPRLVALASASPFGGGARVAGGDGRTSRR